MAHNKPPLKSRAEITADSKRKREQIKEMTMQGIPHETISMQLTGRRSALHWQFKRLYKEYGVNSQLQLACALWKEKWANLLAEACTAKDELSDIKERTQFHSGVWGA